MVLGLLLTSCAPAAAPAPTDQPGAGQRTPREQVVDAAKKEGKLLLYGRLLGGVEGTRYTEEFRKRYGIEVYFIDGGKA